MFCIFDPWRQYPLLHHWISACVKSKSEIGQIESKTFDIETTNFKIALRPLAHVKHFKDIIGQSITTN